MWSFIWKFPLFVNPYYQTPTPNIRPSPNIGLHKGTEKHKPMNLFWEFYSQLKYFL